MASLIEIHWDFTRRGCKYKSYFEIIEMISDDKIPSGVIYTHEILFFDFKYLSNSINVEVKSKDGKGVVLSKLLGYNPYCDKNIRRGHKAYKYLLSGSLQFKKDRFNKHKEKL